MSRFNSPFNKELNDKIGDLSENTQTLSNNKFKWKGNDRAIISIVFDDGKNNLYTTAYPILKQRNFPFGIAFNMETSLQQNASNDLMSYESMMEVRDNGVEIMSHGANHIQLSDAISKEKAIYELKTNKDILNRYGFKSKGFVAPISDDTKPSVADAYKPLIEDYYDYSIYDYVYNVYQPASKTTSHGLKRTSLKDGIDKVKGYIDTAIANKDWLILWCHRVDDTDISVADFTTMMDYLKTKVNASLCEVLTMEQTYEKYTTMFAKGKSYNENKLKSNETGKNYLFNPVFYSNGMGWTQAKSNNNASIAPQPNNGKIVFLMDTNTAINDTVSIKQKVNLTYFKQSLLSRVRFMINSAGATTNNSAKLAINLRFYANTTLLNTTSRILPLSAGENTIDELLNVPFLFTSQPTHMEFELVITKLKNEFVRFEMLYPYLGLFGTRTYADDSIFVSNIQMPGADAVLSTDNTLDVWYTLNPAGEFFSKNNISSGVITVKETGLYEVSLDLMIKGGASSSGYMRLAPYVNGSKATQVTRSVSLANGVAGNIQHRSFLALQANDALEIKYTKDFADLTLLAGSTLLVRKIG